MSKDREPFEYYDEWRSDALCATPENRIEFFEKKDIWFPIDPGEPGFDDLANQRNTAKALSICADCPVRDLCLREALETQTLSGTRGGLTQEVIRSTLSVDETGKEIRRGDFPDCPFCDASTEHLIPTKIDLPDGGRWSEAKAVKCGECGFEWKSRSSHNSVLAYFADRKKRDDQKRREQIARERLSI